ncbi:XRE family transcriptional regulator [Streptomyces sp. H39-C1]|uniref:XRE family transcriptional regulator n=1 Tax=Streptomyces sp. H39-C1 TaxID=3004355 RepID=UPI0022AFBAC1|nr:XRE family transcriptional regulator [Streptomyces sp. H39-C1]MCZ4098059.1 XRE family transcriptional regulator [Streptomyces sp. H39-C1]
MAVRKYAARLLDGRHTLGQAQELAHAAGMLSVVLAWLAHDLGEPQTALAYCADARAHGTAAGMGDVCAWADDAAATTCLYADQPQRAADYAFRGLTAATSTAARVRLAAQTARAQARSGNADAFVSARRLAHEAAAGLPPHASGLFSADQVRLLSFDATSYLALGQPRPARAAAEDAVTEYDSAAYRSPTRAAIAHLDLADAHAALGGLDVALTHGSIALRVQRHADAINTRAHHLANTLILKDSRSPAVQSFVQKLAH